MHPNLTSDSKVLRRGSYRFLGPVFLVFAAFTAFMLIRYDGPLAGWVAPILLCAGGLWFLMVDSRYILFREGGRLYWADHHGRKRDTGSVEIGDISRLEVYRMRPANKPREAAALQIELAASEGHRFVLPRNLGFGGPGNPRYDDLVNELRQMNPAVELVEKDVEGWRPRKP